MNLGRYGWFVPARFRTPPKVTRSRGARSPLGRGAARLGEKMGKDGWTTIGLPDELYQHVRNLIPAHATSVSEYVRFWVGIGIRFDRAAAASPEVAKIAKALLEALQEDEG